MKNELINELLNIKESYQMPDALFKLLTKDKETREMVFDTFLSHESDLSYDWFTDYFQQEHGDRKTFKQDFTPLSVCNVIKGLIIECDSVLDVCSGTGGLIIKTWLLHKNAKCFCEEISSRAIPILLFNLSIRGIEGQVIHGDVLNKRVDAIYVLKKNGKYSDIILANSIENQKVDVVIQNPPYSMRWEEVDDFKKDERFEIYGLPPKAKADYGFVLHGLHKLNDYGILIAILPHGVLFRSGSEQKIRRNMIAKHKIDAIIGLPDKLFLNTSIPVCIMILKKEKVNEDILFIDASNDFVNKGKQNYLNEHQINKIINAYHARKNIEKYSHIASMEEIEKNDFNLNITRFVDTFEPEQIPDLIETIDNLIAIDKEINVTEDKLLNDMMQLVGKNSESQEELDEVIKKVLEYRR